MCLDCGCNMPHERHGDDRHLVIEDLEAAAKANGNTLATTWQTVQRSMTDVMAGRPKAPAQPVPTRQ